MFIYKGEAGSNFELRKPPPEENNDDSILYTM